MIPAKIPELRALHLSCSVSSAYSLRVGHRSAPVVLFLSLCSCRSLLAVYANLLRCTPVLGAFVLGAFRRVAKQYCLTLQWRTSEAPRLRLKLIPVLGGTDVRYFRSPLSYSRTALRRFAAALHWATRQDRFPGTAFHGIYDWPGPNLQNRTGQKQGNPLFK